jgi:cytochrome P450
MNANARELAAQFDLEKLTDEFYADPYPTYRALREHEPVKLMPNGSWFLTRYDDLVSAYKTTKLFSSDKKKEFLPKYGDSMLYEHHTPRVQRSACPHQGAAADHGRAVAARDRRDGA